MVLHELDAGVEVGCVELVGNVPAQRPELASLLDHSVQEGHAVQHWLPLRHVGDVQEILGDTGICSLEACLHALRRLIGELDGNLENESGIDQ